MSDRLDELEEKVTAALVNGQLPCPSAFKIAREFEVSIGKIGDTTDRLGIKISNCQLGCFP